MKKTKNKPFVKIYPVCDMTIYTDGSCTNNGTKDAYGSYGFVILKDNQIVHEYAEFRTGITSNQAEMLAIIHSLQWLIDNSHHNKSILVKSDSSYCINGINSWIHKWKENNWNNGSVMNKQLWKDMDCVVRQLNVQLRTVKGHNGEEWNEYVDMLCSAAVEKEGGISFEESVGYYK
jgi:ribonuclease HI